MNRKPLTILERPKPSQQNPLLLLLHWQHIQVGDFGVLEVDSHQELASTALTNRIVLPSGLPPIVIVEVPPLALALPAGTVFAQVTRKIAVISGSELKRQKGREVR